MKFSVRNRFARLTAIALAAAVISPLTFAPVHAEAMKVRISWNKALGGHLQPLVRRRASLPGLRIAQPARLGGEPRHDEDTVPLEIASSGKLLVREFKVFAKGPLVYPEIVASNEDRVPTGRHGERQHGSSVHDGHHVDLSRAGDEIHTRDALPVA